MKKSWISTTAMLLCVILLAACSASAPLSHDSRSFDADSNQFVAQVNKNVTGGYKKLQKSDEPEKKMNDSINQWPIEVSEKTSIEMESYAADDKVFFYSVALSIDGSEDPGDWEEFRNYMKFGIESVTDTDPETILQQIGMSSDKGSSNLGEGLVNKYQENGVTYYLLDYHESLGKIVCGFEI